MIEVSKEDEDATDCSFCVKIQVRFFGAQTWERFVCILTALNFGSMQAAAEGATRYHTDSVIPLVGGGRGGGVAE